MPGGFAAYPLEQWETGVSAVIFLQENGAFFVVLGRRDAMNLSDHNIILILVALTVLAAYFVFSSRGGHARPVIRRRPIRRLRFHSARSHRRAA